TPLCRSQRPPTPRKNAPGMVQPSSDGRAKISLPQSSRSINPKKKNRSSKEPSPQVVAPRLSKKRKTPSQSTHEPKSPKSSGRPLDDQVPSDTEMNQDSDDGLTERQQSKRAKVLESEDEDEDPRYAPVKDYFGPP
ncbi:hypothetical protein DFH28DRAFT_865483, partial [Melampsora americana]